MKRTVSRSAGFTLIEMLVAISISTVLMGTLAAVISRVMAANEAVGRHLEGIAALGAMGEQFRSDVHAASGATIIKESETGQRLQLTGPDGAQIEYEIAEAGLRRTVSRSGQQPAREMFVLSGMKVLGWNENFQAGGELAMLVGRLARRGDDDRAVVSQFSIAAPLARDRPRKEAP